MALALMGVYVLGMKIHERYLFIALPLLLMAYATTKDRRALGLLAGFSATTFVNTAIVLDNSILFGSNLGHLNPDTLGLNVALSILNLLLWGYAGYVSFTGLRASRELAAKKAPKRPLTAYRQALLSPRDPRLNLTGKDWLVMGVTTALFAALPSTNLAAP